MKRTGAILTLIATLLAAGSAKAWLETGTLLTNSASATYGYRGVTASVSYSATMKVFLANPAVFVSKDCTPTVVGSVGGLVTYSVCFSNGGSSTAFNLTVNDRLPNGDGAWWQGYGTGSCGYVGCDSSLGYGLWVGGGAAAWASYSMDGGASWSNGTPPMGQQAPVMGLMLRWRVPILGIGVSGGVTFVVSLG